MSPIARNVNTNPLKVDPIEQTVSYELVKYAEHTAKRAESVVHSLEEKLNPILSEPHPNDEGKVAEKEKAWPPLFAALRAHLDATNSALTYLEYVRGRLEV